jgi:hypothetical protein
MVLGAFRQSEKLSKQVATHLIGTKKVPISSEQQQKIVTNLLSGLHSHGYPISLKLIQEMGVDYACNILDLKNGSEIWEVLVKLNNFYRDYGENFVPVSETIHMMEQGNNGQGIVDHKLKTKVILRDRVFIESSGLRTVLRSKSVVGVNIQGGKVLIPLGDQTGWRELATTARPKQEALV